MNEQIQAVIKAALISLGTTLFVQKGWLDDTTLQTVVGSIITLGTVAWAVWARRKAGIIHSAAKLDEVQQVVVTDPRLVASAVRGEVVSPTTNKRTL